MTDPQASCSDGSLTTPAFAAAAALAPAPKPLLLLLVGVPGSGKSTVAARLRQAGWAVVSQDVLGDRRRCESAVACYLREGRNVVIDRCNFDVRQRATWLQIANTVCGGAGSFAPMTLRLATDLAECRRRVLSRTDHPTLNGPDSAAVIDRFQQDFVRPKAAEGFAARFVARRPLDAELLIPLLIAAAAGGSTPPAVPADLLDSDNDPCCGAASRPAWQQRSGRQQSWQQRGPQYPNGGRASPSFSGRGRGWQPAAGPRLPAGQLWQPPGARPQGAAPQQQAAAGSSAAAPDPWRRPDDAPYDGASQRQPESDGSCGGPVSQQLSAVPAAPTWRAGAAEQSASWQCPGAPSVGRQRQPPPPYRPPGW